MKIDGSNLPISIDSYIWLIKRAYYLKVVVNKYINSECSPYDILGHLLHYIVEEDMLQNRYIHGQINSYQDNRLAGTLDTKGMIKNLSFVNGKVLGKLAYTKNERVLNTEILTMIHTAIQLLLQKKNEFNSKEIYNLVELMNSNPIFSNYGDVINMEYLTRKYIRTKLSDTVAICKLITDSEIRDKDKESNDNIDNCSLISIRHLIERALRLELQNQLKFTDIEVFKDTTPCTETTPGMETDISVLGNRATIIEVKTGILDEKRRKNWVYQTRTYVAETADKYNMRGKVNGIVLHLIGQKHDTLNQYQITDFETMEELISKGNTVTVVGIDLSGNNPDDIVMQIEHLAKLIVEYNKIGVHINE